MTPMKYTEILKKNARLGSQNTGEIFRIVVLSNITVVQIKEILELSLREEGINAEVVVGNYDSIIQDSIQVALKANAVVVFWEAANFIDNLHTNISVMQSSDIVDIAMGVENEIDLVLRNLKDHSLVLLNSFSSLAFDSYELDETSFKKLCREMNTVLKEKKSSNQIIVDIDPILAKTGISHSIDFRQYISSKNLYTIKFLKSYVEAIKPAFMAANGRSRKVLVLDCDNTLWSGILGEDGIDGIQMSDLTFNGKVFREVQTLLRGLRKNGILLALCSKNNVSDVEHIFRTHPDILLKEDDIVAKKINWQDKPKNIKDLAVELNLGLDSFVFLDDSEFELGLVQQALPQVKCIQVPTNLSEYPNLIRSLYREFFCLSKSSEDQQRSQMYQQEIQRKKLLKQFNSLDDYLASLDLEITIYWDCKIQISRAAQLTQKTNQFNLTTKRYTELDIEKMLASPKYILAAFSVKDCYGEYGVTGLVILEKKNDIPSKMFIDTFLMSCRVIGRNIEFAFFDKVVQELQYRGVTELHTEYLATSKNEQVRKFYDILGFEVVQEKEDYRNYVIQISNYRPRSIEYIRVKSHE